MEEKPKTMISRTLKGTSFVVVVELDLIQYQHYRLATGRRPTVPMPMDINVMREMAALAAHFEREGPKRPLVEDEARDAAEMVDGH